MTLIVAHKIQNEIILCGDTRLLTQDKQTLDALKGALKVIIISENLCIAYAGNVSNEFAIKLPSLCNELVDKSQEYVLSHLFKIHNFYSGNLDFIVASLRPETEISVIKNMQILRNSPSAWIGDASAFNLYQKNRIGIYNRFNNTNEFLGAELYIKKMPENSEIAQDAYSSMCDAFESVIQNEDINSVGNFYTSVSSNNSIFSYLSYAYLGAPKQPPHSGERTIEFGSAEEGGCNLTALTPTKPGISAIGFHYFQGNLGILFLPKLFFNPIVFKNTSCGEFIKLTKFQYDVSLDGPKFS